MGVRGSRAASRGFWTSLETSKKTLIKSLILGRVNSTVSLP